MMLHDVLGDKAPALVSLLCWIQCGITLYAYNTCGKWCMGLVLCGQQAEHHVPDEQDMFERIEPYVSNVVSFLAFSHAIDHALSPLLYESMCM